MIIYSSLEPRLRKRAALLIDLENIAYTTNGELVSAHTLGARLDEVLDLAGVVQHRLVAAQRHMLLRYGPELAARNLRWQECPCGPDEADRALTERGLGLLLRGFGQIVIASGDHFFAPFGDLCDLRVVVPHGVGVSARLVSAGTVVTASQGADVRYSRSEDTNANQSGIPISTAA